MTFLHLKAIKDFLEEQFEGVRFRSPKASKEEQLPVAIHIGALPPKRSGENEQDFPFIVIRPSDGEDDEEGSTVTVKIICGIYTGEGVDGGFNDVLNMVGRCRRAFLQSQLLEKKYVLKLPIGWKLGEDEESGHPHPYYHGTITTTWDLPPIDHLLSAEESINTFGSGYPADDSTS